MDLDDEGRFADRYAVLTDTHLFVVGERPMSILISLIEKASVVEALDINRVRIISARRIAPRIDGGSLPTHRVAPRPARVARRSGAHAPTSTRRRQASAQYRARQVAAVLRRR